MVFVFLCRSLPKPDVPAVARFVSHAFLSVALPPGGTPTGREAGHQAPIRSERLYFCAGRRAEGWFSASRQEGGKQSSAERSTGAGWAVLGGGPGEEGVSELGRVSYHRGNILCLGLR